MHIQAAYLKRNCLLEISCSLHISAFIKYDLTEETKWKSISCNSKLWLQCNGFIMSRMINTANRRLFQKQLPNRSLHLSSSSPLSSLCSPCPGGRQGHPGGGPGGGTLPCPLTSREPWENKLFSVAPFPPHTGDGGLTWQFPTSQACRGNKRRRRLWSPLLLQQQATKGSSGLWAFTLQCNWNPCSPILFTGPTRRGLKRYCHR